MYVGRTWEIQRSNAGHFIVKAFLSCKYTHTHTHTHREERVRERDARAHVHTLLQYRQVGEIQKWNGV